MEQLKNIMVEADKNVQVHEFDLVAPSSSSSFESGNSSESSLASDSFDEVTSPAASSSSSDDLATYPLSDMSTLFQQLPIKRGLSKYYQGKAQSFTSLAKVSSLEDLAKPENPYKKKLKCCRSHAVGMGDEGHNAKCTTNNAISSSRHGSKRRLHSRGSCSSLMSAKRGSDNFTGSRPPIPPHRPTSSNTIPNQAVFLV